MTKRCVFCGERPVDKNKEHVIPQWLIRATGDPKRLASFGTFGPTGPQAKTFAFDQLTFPACLKCNEGFSGIEGQAQSVVERMLERRPLADTDFSVLLDWLDKVRVGMWLGLRYLGGDPWGIEPNFHISRRVRLHDRVVGLALIEQRQQGINMVGAESPCFGLSPTTMCLFINDIGLFNSSAIDLCSRRLGFPFLTDLHLRDDGLMTGQMARGLERIIRPVQRTVHRHSIPHIYQPILERFVGGEIGDVYDTAYVRENSLDFDAGLGALFLQVRGRVSKYKGHASLEWLPGDSMKLRETYSYARRWAYNQLEHHYGAQAQRQDELTELWPKAHRKLLAHYEDVKYRDEL